LRGKALLAADELDRAIADFNEALRLKPKYAEALAARGFAASKKRDYVR
jgi:Flp pilus assembly protein TadD